jgi:transposase
MSRITFQEETVKELQARMGKAYQSGNVRLVRHLAVLIGIARGEGLAEVLAVWHLCEATVYGWLKDFVEQRWDSLGYTPPTGRPARLTKQQKQQLVDAVKAGPEAAGYACGCWTTTLIQEWIFQHFQVTYSRFYVAELLRNLGLSYQKARFVSDHLDEEKRKAWIETVWPAILAQAQREGQAIFFEDEVCFAQWGSLSYTWAPKGCQPQVKTSGLRKGYKIFGLIEFFTGRFYWLDCEERFNSLTYQIFLTCLLEQVPGPKILIQDGARYHTSRETRTFFAEHADQLAVYQLPSYSPDYNPIEYLWKKVKTKATHNRYFAEFSKLVRSVEDALSSFDAQPQEILRLMGLYTDSRPAASAA